MYENVVKRTSCWLHTACVYLQEVSSLHNFVPHLHSYVCSCWEDTLKGYTLITIKTCIYPCMQTSSIYSNVSFLSYMPSIIAYSNGLYGASAAHFHYPALHNHNDHILQFLRHISKVANKGFMNVANLIIAIFNSGMETTI